MRKLAFGLVLVLFGMALPPFAPFAAAQVPLGLNLEGTWELVEYGQRRDPANPLVHILDHGDGTVTARFLSGAHCFDGKERAYAFVGKLVSQPTVPPMGRLESDDMWVCSNSPSIVKRCGISSSYQSTFTNAIARSDLIDGMRTRQAVSDSCATQLDSVEDSKFTLTRVTCPEDARTVAQLENGLRNLLNSREAMAPEGRRLQAALEKAREALKACRAQQ